MSNYDSAVAKGVALLDEKSKNSSTCGWSDCGSSSHVIPAAVPADWRKRIDFDKLAMSSTDKCILGQIFGSFESGKVKLGLAGDPTVQAYAYGYDTGGLTGSYALLRDAWKKALGKSDLFEIEVGKTYESGYKTLVKVLDWTRVSIKGEMTKLYVVQIGKILNGKAVMGDERYSYASITAESIRKQYPKGEYVPAPVFTEGMFLVNDAGKMFVYIDDDEVWSVQDKANVWKLSDVQALSTNLRELTTSDGTPFRKVVS